MHQAPRPRHIRVRILIVKLRCYSQDMSGYLIYCRISRDLQGESAGVQSQEESCRELAATNGWEVADTYIDNDISAFSGKTRPSWEAMIDRAKAGGIDGIICWHVDRLYRRSVDLERLVNLVEETGTMIHTVRAGDLDLNTSTGRLVARLSAAAASGEVEHQIERQKASHAYRAKLGKWRGGPIPVGYKRGENKGEIVPDDTYAPHVQLAVQMTLDGRSLMSIAKRFNEDGVPTRRFGAGKSEKWTARGIRSAVVNPAIAGLARHHGEIVGKGQWEPLVSEEDWRAAEQILTDPSRKTHAARAKRFQGTGLYECGRCGKKMGSGKGKTAQAKADGTSDRVYACKHCFRCQRRMIPTDEVVDGVILGYLSEPENRIKLVDRQRGADEADIRSLLDRYNSLVARKNELGRAYADGVMDLGQVKAATDELRTQIESVSAELARTRQRSPAADLVLSDGTLGDRWNELAPEVRGQVIDELVTVTIMPSRPGPFDPEAIRIEWK